MTQKKQIQLLESILPDIVRENDPEGVMLKCAKKNNLAPAQLEKLAQVFNTYKTVVGLTKQANRGDSFSIVDVPSLVSRYTDYDPAASLSPSAAKVHCKVDKLMKSASAASGPADGGRLPNAFSFESGESGWAAADSDEYGDAFSVSKQASQFAGDIQDRRDGTVYRSITGNLNLAVDTASQVAYDSHMDILEKCAGIMHRLTPDDGRWAECVRDIADNLGLEKAASVITAVESYFIDHRHHFKPADLQKDAAADDSVFARDRHGVVDDAMEIYDLQQINKQAKEQLAVYEKAAGKDSGRGGSSDDDDDIGTAGVKSVDALLSEIKPSSGGNFLSPVVDPKTTPVAGMITSLAASRGALVDPADKKYLDESKKKAESEAAIQQLMMSDPTISEADPEEVRALYETVSKLSPTVAKDPVILGPVLKEALQYGSLPIQQVKDLLEAEKNSLNNKIQLAKL